MYTYLQKSINWTNETSMVYGVNPVILGILYFGTIPISVVCFGWLVRNFQKKRSLAGPLLGLFLSFIGTYVYLFLVARNIPPQGYLLILILMFVGLWQLFRKYQHLVKK